MASFTLPKLAENSDRWGPPPLDSSSSSSSSVLPPEFADIPFAPFSKSDKIGRIADWNASSAGGATAIGGGRDGDDRSARNAAQGAGGRGGRREGPAAYGSGASNAFAYFHADDEATFSVVDNTRSQSTRGRGGLASMSRGGGGGGRGGRGGGAAGGAKGAMGGARGGRGGAAAGGNQRNQGFASRGGGARRGGYRDWDKPQRTRDPSVTVGPDWEQLEEIDFSRLAKLRLDVPAPEDIATYGTLHEYDRSYDRIASVRFEKPLQPQDRLRYNPTTSDDPVLAEIAAKDAQAKITGEEGSGAVPARLFITDSILALLMCASRTVYPWDLTVTVTERGDVFFDKRDGGAFDYVTVNENAADPPMEADEKADKNAAANINTPGNLSLEATYINQNFSFQVVNPSKTLDLPDGPNPFHEGDNEQLASSAYKYRKFDLSSSEEDPIDLYVRTELDAYVPPASKGQQAQYILVRTLNEWDSRAQGAGGAPDWRAKLDAQRGAVVANEMRNNAGRLARWATQSLLAGADNLKMGYISRATPRDSSRHSILGTQWWKPSDLASQINVNLPNGWGVVRTVADLARKSASADGGERAKFVLAKDPNKQCLRLYRVPVNWPQQGEEEQGAVDDEEAERIAANVTGATPAAV
ncbi:translation initiation factor eIF-3, subunit D [Jaminaea rosea]|uniref:Eukaryotic translation initiation factor 3 subunit D n=1 Tax=Jaminaea rosea TaxID=1569628 RepID=A0A316UL99_9BASI|nr:translation initiation factor eIF-3, subunit D [Jaminaea rosea]PWN25161.1 translation initiation factor eIF-3, subunit D [Jaminaea rosea]